jgi:hypothetical protein
MSLHVAECNGPTYMPSRQKAPDSPQRQEWVTQIDVAMRVKKRSYWVGAYRVTKKAILPIIVI